MSPWVFGSPESVRWIVEHPLPIFLCVVQKAEARIIVYHTTPRFAVWALPIRPRRLELVPGTETKATTVDWVTGDSFNLKAPILNFTVQEVLDSDRRASVADVLKFWIDYDVQNLARIRDGIPYFWAPANYETNSTEFLGWMRQGGCFQEESLVRARSRLKELLGVIATHCYQKKEIVNATIFAMALRQLSPKGYSNPTGPGDLGSPHDIQLHNALNRIFGLDPPNYVFQACDSLLKLVKDEVARHDDGIADPPTLPGTE